MTLDWESISGHLYVFPLIINRHNSNNNNDDDDDDDDDDDGNSSELFPRSCFLR